MADFSNRVVLITGASGELGSAVTRAFLETGATVIGIARGAAPENLSGLQWIRADLTRPEEAVSAVAEARSLAGRIDVLVHVLGGFEGGTPVAETSDEVWNRMIGMNLNAAFYVLRAAVPHLAGNAHGRVILVGSRTGAVPAAGIAAYAASKAGAHALVQSLALELKDAAVTANVVMPGVIDTAANRSWGKPEQVARWVEPESIAEVILWLAGESGRDVSGALVPVYGRS